MLDLIDKYLNKCIHAFDNIMTNINKEDSYTKQTCAAYIIQTAYRKHLIRRYFKLKQEIVQDEKVWHMNMMGDI